MHIRVFRSNLAISALLISMCLASSAAAQKSNSAKAAPPAKTTPRLSNGHPDFTGFWGGGGGEDAAPKSVGPENLGNHDLTRTANGDVLFLYLGADGYEGPVPLLTNQPP